MSKNKNEETSIYVTAVDACIAVKIKNNTKGKELFEAVCKKFNIYEKHWFGLYFVSIENCGQWLDMNQTINLKKIKQQAGKMAHFDFRIRYYPECSKIELIQDSVKEMFFKHELSRRLTCVEFYYPPEEIVCAVVAFICLLHHENPLVKHEEIIKSRFDKIFSQNIMRMYNLSKEEWIEEIIASLNIVKDQHYMEPIEMCLKIMEQSPSYGVTYYDIVNKKGTALIVGLDCYGINIYKPENKTTPVLNFIWSEVHSVSFDRKLFKIKMVDKTAKKFKFFTRSELQSDQIMTQIIGNHKNFLARRSIPDNEANIEIREAKKQQENEDAKRKNFQKQKQAEHRYEQTFNEIVKTGIVSDLQTKQVEESFSEAVKALEEQIEQARLISEQEKQKREQAEKEKKQLEIIAQEIQEKLAFDEEEKKKAALLEREILSKEEAHKKEIEALEQKLKEADLKHQEDMRKLEELKMASALNTENNIKPKEIKSLEYQEITKAKNAALATKIEKFATLAKTRVSPDSKEAVQFQQFDKNGIGKFETLRMLRKNNTRDRIDEFEALI